PRRGERPLWDFPDGTLSHREVAAFQVSQATGWDVVPPTAWRDGPFGEGSVQLWIDADPQTECVAVRAPGESEPGWLPVLRATNEVGEPVDLVHADDPRLARMAVFDIVVDNADRKGGHILGDARGHIWGVDHGLTFNTEAKLRTVLWGWGGRELPAECLDVLAALAVDLADTEPLGAALREHLAPAELARTRGRISHLLRSRVFPRPDPHGPMIPWPAF
ncbi:MAG: SCO1664 family protein, partial [Angustibacter sp.]